MKKVAVVGLGSIAGRHRRNLREMFPDAEILAAPSRAGGSSGDVEDCDRLLPDVGQLIGEAVGLAVVASPASMHAEHASAFIAAGVPVMVEKPLTADLESAIRLEKAAGGSSTPVAVGYCLRYLASARCVSEFVASERPGDVQRVSVTAGQYLPDWRPGKDYRRSVSAQSKLGGGVLLELSHEIDDCHWLFGPLTVEHATLRNSGTLDIDVEDTADITASTSTGAVVDIHLDFLQRQATRRCTIVSDRGRLDWNLVSGAVTWQTSGETEILHKDDGPDRNEMYVAMLRDFVAKIGGYDNQCVSVAESLAVIRFIDGVRASAARQPG